MYNHHCVLAHSEHNSRFVQYYNKITIHVHVHTVTISLLISLCVLAGSVALISIILLAVSPETFQEDGLTILPNDTILSVPGSGLDPSTVNYITYSYYYDFEQPSSNETYNLFLYQEWCDNLPSLVKMRPVSIEHSFSLPEGDLALIEIDTRYLLAGSTIEYNINLTLENVPPYCYARLYLKDTVKNEIEAVEICNSTTANFSVSATRNFYALVHLSIIGKNVHIQAIDIQATGIVRYYDTSESQDQLDCQINPQHTSCSIPIRSSQNSNGDYYNSKICILASLKSSVMLDLFSSTLRYKIASFSYGQVIPLVLLCIGLVSFVCTLSILFSCFTKQGRRLRVAMRMSSPIIY